MCTLCPTLDREQRGGPLNDATQERTMQSPHLLAIAAAAAFLGATASASAADRRFSSDAARWSNGGLSRLAKWERPKVG